VPWCRGAPDRAVHEVHGSWLMGRMEDETRDLAGKDGMVEELWYDWVILIVGYGVVRMVVRMMVRKMMCRVKGLVLESLTSLGRQKPSVSSDEWIEWMSGCWVVGSG
jgi:hypothetical protein